MNVTTLLADPAAISLSCFVSELNSITVVVRSVQPKPCCPRCGQPSSSLHSHYTRTVADLPWHGVAIKLQLHTRKFRCHDEFCTQKVFCERLPKVVAAYGRKTVRLNEALTLLSFALGGQAGAKTARRLGLFVSGDTLLRRIRRFPVAPPSTPRVLGVDDWAKRKGQTYGTILVDLEKREPIELLPDSEAETLAQWLKAHPGVKIIARDRSGAYAEGARQGSPHAQQVADRWHLLRNLTEAVERVLQSRQTHLHSAAEVVRQAQVSASDIIINSGTTAILSSRNGVTYQQNRARRYGRYMEMAKMQQQGVSVLGIAQALRMSRMTVYRYLNTKCSPERVVGKGRSSKLRSYLPYIHRRWAEGCHNAMQLWREVTGQGYRGKPAMVRRYVRRLRVRVGELPETEKVKVQRLKSAFQTPSAKRAAHMLLKEGKKLRAEEELFIEQLLRLCPAIGQIKGLGQSFQNMVRERDVKQLDEWLGTAKGSGIKEMVSFAEGLGKDQEAVAGALSYQWSNGQTEGQINRLKLIKRQMYGRAKFELLRARVLYAG